MDKVIAVMSCKGGVGKTVTASNLALALSSVFGKKVLAVDTNITTASLGIHFDVLYPKVGLYDLLLGKAKVEDAIVKINNNLDLIPSAIRFERKDKSLAIVSEQVRQLTDLYGIILSSLAVRYDLIIMDTAPGFNAESVSAMKVADGILVVSNPEYPTLVATANLIKYAKILKVPTGGLILNKVMGKSFEISKEEVERTLKIKVMKVIPFEKSIPESVRNLSPVVNYKKHSSAAVAYKELAGMLVKQKYKKSFAEKIYGVFG